MKVFPAVVIVLLAFAAFFMTFLVAPLAVLTIFYVIYSTRTSSAVATPAPEPEPHLRWAIQPEPEPATPAARRARITVVSHGEEPAAQDVGVTDAASSGAPPSPSPGARTTTSIGSDS
jgi:hypothetical protein